MMKFGLAIAEFDRTDGSGSVATALQRTAETAELVGFTRLVVVDHLWQFGDRPTESAMLEAYTTLGYLAAATSLIELLTLVTNPMFRQPGLLAKIVTTLDVLSGGRAWLGIGVGAPFSSTETEGLGLPFPPVAERFDRLEETLQICLQMWSSDERGFVGQHYRLGRTLNSPQPLRRPHPPILIAGSSTKTLKLVAQYADACNLIPSPDLPRRLAALRAHCETIGRSYGEIEKTLVFPMDPGPGGRNIDRLLAQLRHLEELGIDAVYGPVPSAEELSPLQLLGRELIPAFASS
jgi:F420-dependent oxidoreductase-like protein